MPYKILHIITRFRRGGGTERNTIYSIQALDKSGFLVDVAVGRDSDFSYARSALEEANKIVVIKSLDNSFNPLRNIKALFEIFWVVRRNRYVIVHTHQCKASILGAFAGKMAGVPVIILGLHGDYLMNPKFQGLWRKIYKFIERLAVKCATILISVGDEVKERYIKRYDLSPSRCEVVRSGIDLTKFYEASSLSKEQIIRKKRELNIKPDEIVIGKVSSLEPRKGYKFAIRAAEKIIRSNTKNIKFLFVGEGEQKAELQAMVKRLGLEDKIFFTGFRSDLDEVMGMFDIFVFTSLMEGLPQVLVQAAACGKPIVSFEVEGAKEIVRDGVSGFIIPPGDIDELVEKVNYLLLNPEKAAEMGRQARQSIGNKWNVEVMKDRIIAIYNKLNETYLASPAC